VKMTPFVFLMYLLLQEPTSPPLALQRDTCMHGAIPGRSLMHRVYEEGSVVVMEVKMGEETEESEAEREGVGLGKVHRNSVDTSCVRAGDVPDHSLPNHQPS